MSERKYKEIKSFLYDLKKDFRIEKVIFFGSRASGAENKNSDIDLFIYGKDDELDQAKYERLLNREIQVFTCKNKGELKKLNNMLIRNIVKGDLIKGDINFLEVSASA